MMPFDADDVFTATASGAGVVVCIGYGVTVGGAPNFANLQSAVSTSGSTITHVSQVTIGADGRVTSASNVAITSGGSNVGTALLDFGSTETDSASVAVSAPTILNTSIPQAWVYPVATSNKTVDEQVIEELFVYAEAPTAGTQGTDRG